MVTMSSFNLNTVFNTTVKATAKVTIVVFFIFLSACATPKIGPVPEQVEPDVPTGPGIMTGETGDFSVSDFFDPEKRNKDNRRSITVTGSDVDIPAIDLDSFEEFERFKAWRRAQEVGSIEYQEWLDYQDFLRLKAEK
ncbi:MAG: hypothetical protein ACJA1S_001665 [Cellvibrionaceae bacterium]|jgi:hypothetical protein